MWYIVILTSTDWYTIFEKSKIVKADSVGEAESIALEGEYKHVQVEKTYCTGRTKPKE